MNINAGQGYKFKKALPRCRKFKLVLDHKDVHLSIHTKNNHNGCADHVFRYNGIRTKIYDPVSLHRQRYN